MARARIARFAVPTLAAFLIFFAVDSVPAQTPASPAGGQATVSPAATSPANSSAASAAAPASSSPATPPIQGSPPPSTSHDVHVVTVTFDYDFTKTPACTAKITTHCVSQFIAYDISGGAKHPVMLFPIPLPSNPAGQRKGITQAGPPLDFESGKHRISVSAMSPDGTHSRRSLCTTWITIP
jgi:hypothetical protein